MKIAAIQAAPVFLDLDGTVSKTIGLIEEAARNGAEVIGFPEGFVPGHPGWVELLPQDRHTLALSKRLFKNAVEVPGEAIGAIAEACGRGEIAAVVGICERRAGSTGTLFNTQVFIDAAGRIAEKHQKIVPTIGEKLVHGNGGTGIANSMAHRDITVTGLICGENSNPLWLYATAVRYPTVHVAGWPQHFNTPKDMQQAVEIVSRGLAYSLKTFVINSVTTISEEMIDAYATTDAIREFMTSDAATGRSSVISPAAQVIARAETADEQIVYADIDPDDVIVPKFIHDTAGHYNRPELFAHLFDAPSGHPSAG